jgi:hypothetical protein
MESTRFRINSELFHSSGPGKHEALAVIGV